VTALKLVEQRRENMLATERAAREEAERVIRMKDEFLATLSHELRTPLNAILGWSQILTRGPLESEDARQGLQAIERNTRAQAQMIEDLLDMSRITAGKVRLNVHRMIRKVRALPTVNCGRVPAVADRFRSIRRPSTRVVSGISTSRRQAG
jgi:signal transduction histidine kinase